MTSPPEQINALVKCFVEGQSYRDFHRDFTTFHESFDDTVLPVAQRDAYWALYDLVYMAQPDPSAPSDASAALIGENELRERLRHFRLQEPARPPT